MPLELKNNLSNNNVQNLTKKINIFLSTKKHFLLNPVYNDKISLNKI